MKVVLENLTKTFTSKVKKTVTKVNAVDNFNLEIPDGTLVGLLGPSGCGKSTALNLISGLLKPTEGKIYFGETDVTNVPPEKRGVGLVFQNYALYPHLSVRDNILFPLQNLRGKNKPTKAEMNERMLEAARLVEIDTLLDRKPKELSGGQMQRVAIARALVKSPSILLLDEPLSNLDARLRLQTREEIKKIQRDTNITTIFVTHDQDEAMSISDLIVVVKNGVIQQIGKPQEIYDNPQNLFVAQFLGIPKINVVNGTVTNGTLYINGIPALKVKGDVNGDVSVAIRPEGFLLDGESPLSFDLLGVEKAGKDVTVISAHPDADGEKIRAVFLSNEPLTINSDTFNFRLIKNKVHLFDKNTTLRIDCDLEAI